MPLPLTASAFTEEKEIPAPMPIPVLPLYFSSGRTAGRRHLPTSLYHAAKRALDVILAALALLLLWPVLLLIAILVRLDSPGPVLHRREVLARQRLSAREKSPLTFFAFKFRTMVPNADAILQNDPPLRQEYEKEFKLRRDPRVTRFGRFLRPFSLDEFPQLLNVLRGEMTLVGPRMISPPELARYGAHGGTLLSVKPGLTGLWQVSGRHCVTYEERVQLDIWYIEHRSLLLDLVILWRTVGCVLARTGAF
jgi:lipopolysaccharide/colanic/teichoic acid biosynthesis glycosyltransferase